MALDDSLDAAASIGEDSQPAAPARSIADLQKAGYDLSDLAPAGSAKTSPQPNPFADETTPNAPVAKPGWQTNLERAGYDFSGLVSAPPRPPAAPAKTPEPNWFSTAGQALVSGVRGGLTDVAHAPTAFTEHKPEEPDTSPTGKRLSEGISEGWSDPKWWIAHIAHGIGESSPSLATGAAGAYLGSMAGPVGTVVGGAGGFAVGSAIQTVAPAYQRAIADGLSHDDAVRRAIAETGVASAFGAAMGMGPGAVARVIEKPLSRALAEIFVVQPGLGAAQQVSQGAVAGHIPTADELATGAAENIGIGGVLAGGHRVIAGRHVPPAAQEETPAATAPLPPLDLTDVAEPPLDLFNPLPPLPPPMRPLTPGERDTLIHQQARSEQLGEQDRLNHQAEYDRIAAEREQQQTDANAARIAERQAAQQRQDLQQAGTTQAPVLPELDAARQRAEGEAAQDQAATGQAPAADISFTGETPADTRTSDVSRETPAAEPSAVAPRPPQEPAPRPPAPQNAVKTWGTLTPVDFSNGRTLRLYRGENPSGQEHAAGSPSSGGWFTTDPTKAALYGPVSYVDVTPNDLRYFGRGHGGDDEFVTDNPDFRNRSRPIAGSETESTHSPQEPPAAEPEPPTSEPAPQPPAPAGGGAAARPQASDWTAIGKNYIGQTLYEDQRGVRSTIERGIRSTEPVGLRPSRDGMQLSVDRTDRPEYQIAEPHPANPRDVEYQPPAPASPEAEATPQRGVIPFAPVENGQSNAFTYKGDAVPVEYGIVDARTLVTSNHDDLSPNPEFPQELQPRDRTRPETELQIQNLLNPTRFRPELLGPGPNAGSGTPIISPNGVVEGGNARSIALRRAYAQNLPIAETYRSWLANQGYPVNGIEQPVLVRMNRAPMDMAQREAFARDMNIPDQAAMSPSENASADARRITPDVLATYQGGNIDSAANRNFLRGILRSIVPENQYGAFIAPDGEITRPGLQRIQAALIARAYGDQGLVGKLVEDADNNIRAIGSGLLDAAPTWAQMRDATALGRLPPEFDITNHLVNAVQLISHAREQGRNIAEFVQQRDMFGGALPAETEGVLQWMVGGQNFSRRFGRDKIGTALLDYAESAMRQGRPALPGVERPDVQQLIEGARQRAQGAAGDLFDQKVGQPTGASAVRSGIDQNRPEVQGPGPDKAGLDTPAAGAETAAEAAGQQQPAEVATPAPAPRPSDYGANNKLVTNADVESIRARIRKKLDGSQLNAGIDPELMVDGARMAAYHIEAGARKFADFAREMLSDFGDSIRPYLRTFYESARHWPDFEPAREMSPGEEIDAYLRGETKQAEEAAQAAPEAPPSVPVQEAWHAKKGAPVFVVKHPSSLDDAAYADLKKRATDLGGYWSSFKKQGAIPGWQFADRASAERFARMLGERESSATTSATHSNDPTIALSDRVADMLNKGEPITQKSLHETAAEIFGGTLAEGKVSRDQLYDAMELGVNKYIRSFPDELSPRADLSRALENVRALEKLKNELPTQSVRAGEKDTHQQFSTPPDYAYAAAWIAHLRPEDRVLEPSAGTGSLAVHAMNAGAREVSVNELSNKRASLVESLIPARAFRENAEQLHNILPEDVKPSVVLMNPPFSVAPDRMGSARVLAAGAAHIYQALKRLEPGGRLVAIVGRGMTMDAPTFRDWWKDVANQYDVRANIGVDGKVYSKYGTTFDTRLLVIDKNPPSGTAPVTGDVKSIPELLERLEGTRNERVGAQRTAGEPLADQPGSEAVVGGGEGRPGAVAPVSPATGDARPGTRGGDTGIGAGPAARPGTRGGANAEPASRPGQGDALVSEQSERPGAVGTEPGPAAPPGTGEDLAGSGAGGDGDVLRPDTGGESVLPPSGEPAGLTEQVPDEITRTQEAEAAPEGEITETVYEPYKPQRVTYEGAATHPSPLVQSAAMATVLPPATDYAPKFTGNYVKSGVLSDAQLEGITYAGAAHSKMLSANEGETPYRAGFFIGDGTGPQPLTAKLLTPTGWRSMGDIKVGDQVISVDGTPTKVIGVYPQGEKSVFKIRFNDGAETEACGDHLWSTTDKEQRYFRTHNKGTEAYWRSKILSTDAIKGRIHRAHDTPVASPIDFPAQPLSLDPYLIGALLGDGCLRKSAAQFVAVPAMMPLFFVTLPPGVWANKVRSRDYHYDLVKIRGENRSSKSNPLIDGLRQIGIAGLRAWEKHVPESVLFNSQDVRLACLRGLMDTDGYADKHGISSYTSVSEQLANDVIFLVRSLGGIARISTKVTKKRLAYNVSVKLSVCPFIYPAKAKRWRLHEKYPPRRYFESIEPTGTKPVQCIRVEHPSHLYVTDDFIVTHNTGKGREIAGIILDNWNQGRKKAVWVSENSPLVNDARRDWSGIGQDEGKIFEVGKIKRDNPIDAKEGIAFVPYTTLSSGAPKPTAAGVTKLSNGTKVNIPGQFVEGENPSSTLTGKISKHENEQNRDIYTVKLDNGKTARLNRQDIVVTDIPSSRLDQLVNWLGKDFDGVIAFDEAHNMANAVAQKGVRGTKPASQKAMSGVELQQRLPNARVVYVSATGATEVNNLAYAERLGLWGLGTPFADKTDFISKISNGGIAAMELVARDMKAMGKYVARSLAFGGPDLPAHQQVEYDRIEHKLSPDQRQIYDKMAEGWQVTLNNFNDALEATQAIGNKQAKTAAYSAFWGAHQRFFNQIITSMQMPSVLRAVENDIKEGRQAVLQLVNTNEASQTRALAKVERPEDLEDLDMTPRDQLLQMIDKSFPTQQHEEYVDPDGNVRYRPVVDRDGRPVQNREAVAMKERLLDEVGSIRVPDGPLEMLLNHFGPDKVAEVTGRTQRVVKRQDEQGQMRSVVEKRTAENANVAETTAFQNAQKPILVFSQAGGTGRSYHADIDTPSADKRRSHYLVQAGWRADTAIQGFGRTHRTNQASAPQFHLVTTDLQGQRRFISSIARRLAQLGALTKGERKTGDSGVFSASDNLESREAKNALLQLYTDMVEDHRNPANTTRVSIGLDDFTKQTGLRLLTPDGAMRNDPPPITQFLNRLLSLKIEPQNKLFGEFEQRLQDATARAAADGSLDTGVETVRADHIHKRDEKTVYTEPSSGAESKYVKMELQHRNNPTSYDDIVAGKGPTAGRSPEFFVQSKQTGKIYAVSKASNVTDAQGAVREQYRLSDPLQYRFTTKDRIDGRNADQYWTRIDNAVQARDAWEKQVSALPEFNSHDLHLITGAVLPIWDRLGAGSTRIFRLQTDTGERMLGRVIPDGQVDQVLKNLGAEREAAQYKPQDVVERVMQGDRATLANGWTLAQRTVAGEPRIELTGPSFIHNNELQGANVYSERIDFRTRYFVPTGADAADSVRRLIERHPVTEIAQGRDSGLAEERNKYGEQPQAGITRDLTPHFESFASERGGASSPHETARDFVVRQGKASAEGASHAGHEFLTVYDPLADRVTHAVSNGLEDSVELPADVKARAETDPNAGLVLHHNHPLGRALSIADKVDGLSYPGVEWVVAHGHDGSISAARLSPFMQEQLAGLSREDRKTLLAKYMRPVDKAVSEKLWPLITRHEAGKSGLTISREDANAIHADLVDRALEAAGVIEHITSHDSAAPLGKAHTAYITREGISAADRLLKQDFADYQGANTRDVADRSTRTVQSAEGVRRLSGENGPDGTGQLNAVRDSNSQRLPETQRQVRQGEEAGRAQEGLREADPYNPERDKDYKRIIATDEHVDISQRAKTLTDKIKQEGWLRTQAYWQDRFAAVERLEKAKNVTDPGKLLPAATSPIAAFRLASHSASQVDFAINNGQIRFNRDTGAAEQIPGKKGLVQLLTPLKDRSQQAVRDFFLWKAVKRGERLMAEGRENNIPPDVIARNLDLDRQYQMPDGSNLFHKVDAELRDWFTNLLDFGEATDIVNPKSRLLYENDDYLPFYRKLADDTISGPGGGADGPNVRQPIKQLKGGESKINNPIDNIVTNAAAIIRRGMWNDAANRLADHLGGTDAMTVISRSARVDFGDPEVQKRLRDLGLDPAKMKENEKEAAKDLFGMRKRDDPKLLSFLRSGIPVHAEIHDDLLARAVASVGPTNMDFLTKILAGPARLLRSAVVFDPAFVMAHNIRQAIQAYSLHGVSPFASFAATLRQVRGTDPIGLRLLAGGVMSGVYDVGVPKRVRQRILTPEYQNSLIDTPLKGFHFLKMLSEKAMKASDLGPRVAVYEKMLRQGATEAEALQHASDLLDFGKHGYGGAALFLAQTIPFANARWQGIARFGKGALNKEERAGLLMRGALITAASLALWSINKDDPEYQRKEDWDKQYAWHIKLGPGLWFRLPKNWEIGGLFGTLPEIIADYADNGSARQAQGAVTSLLTNIFKVDPWPAGIKPAVEAYFNKSMFTNRPIVNEAEQGLVPDLRYGPNTHPSIVAATQAYNSVAPGAVQMAPDMVQHLLNGYLAGWGGYIAGAADYLGDQADVLRDRPTARITDYPIINRFVHEAPEAGNRILTDFYSMRQEIDEIGKSIKKARERGDREMMQSLISQHPEWSQGLQHQLDSAAKVLSDRRGILQRQRMNSKLDDDGQRKAIDDFNTWRDKFADTRLMPLLRRAEGLPLQ